MLNHGLAPFADGAFCTQGMVLTTTYGQFGV